MSTSFIITSFYYKITGKKILSENLGFYFDKPRGKIEIEKVAANLGTFIRYKLPTWITKEQKNNDPMIIKLLGHATYTVICRYDYDPTIKTDIDEKRNLLSSYSALVYFMTVKK